MLEYYDWNVFVEKYCVISYQPTFVRYYTFLWQNKLA